MDGPGVAGHDLLDAVLHQIDRVEEASDGQELERVSGERASDDGVGCHRLQLRHEEPVGRGKELEADLIDVFNLSGVDESEDFFHHLRSDVRNDLHVCRRFLHLASGQ